MDHVLSPSDATDAATAEFSSVMTGFEVVDREGARIGTVASVSLGRGCILVDAGRSRLGRRRRSAVHVMAVDEIDLGTFTISLKASKEQVAQAPVVHALEQECERAVVRYYEGCLGREWVGGRWADA